MNQLWRPPVHPPGCDCGCCREWDQCRDDWSDLCQSWEQAECLRKIIRQVLGEQAGGAINGPIAGVTNGSQALPGQVGEFVQGQLTGTTNAPNQQFTVTTITPLALMPGDWDVMASCLFSLAYPQTLTGVQIILNSVPVGASSDFGTWLIGPFTPTAEFSDVTLTTPRNQVNVSVPTPLTFNINVWNWTGAASSLNWDFWVTARRMR